LPKLFLREGSIYLTRRDVIMLDNSMKGRDCRAWIVPESRAVNIDSPFDLFLAEQMLLYAGRNGNAGSSLSASQTSQVVQS
jgi:CMP-N-acetylneuraminic acid synthetase